MSCKVENAIIMAAGTSSRFAPLSYERPKGLITVKGEVLIERQIRQLREAGIQQIVVVVGYKKECFEYLKEKFDVILVENPWYNTRNNHASIRVAEEYLHNSYICSSDNYFSINPFESEVPESYYSAVYADGETVEWCLSEDENGYITGVHVGGSNAWYMLGHTFWSEEFSKKFCEILNREYDLDETADKLWEQIYIEHLNELKMKVRHYPENVIFEFDTLDELRKFDESYVADTRSEILKDLAAQLHCCECDLVDIQVKKAQDNSAHGITFAAQGKRYEYLYENKICRQLNSEVE